MHHPVLWQELALAQFFLGDIEAAARSVGHALSLSPHLPAALHLRSVLRRQTEASNHRDDLRHRLDTETDAELRVALLFALAKELEGLGDHRSSFEALGQGAAIKAARLTIDVGDQVATMHRIAERHSARGLARTGPEPDAEGPLFVIGMPRSGTTLLERMLGRVPGVVPVGELLDLKLVIVDAVRAALSRQPAGAPVDVILGMDAAAIGADYLRGARGAAGQGRW